MKLAPGLWYAEGTTGVIVVVPQTELVLRLPGDMGRAFLQAVAASGRWTAGDADTDHHLLALGVLREEGAT